MSHPFDLSRLCLKGTPMPDPTAHLAPVSAADGRVAARGGGARGADCSDCCCPCCAGGRVVRGAGGRVWHPADRRRRLPRHLPRDVPVARTGPTQDAAGGQQDLRPHGFGGHRAVPDRGMDLFALTLQLPDAYLGPHRFAVPNAPIPCPPPPRGAVNSAVMGVFRSSTVSDPHARETMSDGPGAPSPGVARGLRLRRRVSWPGTVTPNPFALAPGPDPCTGRHCRCGGDPLGVVSP